MSNVITFTSIKALKNVDNKKLEKDKNGYSKIILGALNADNVHGEHYILTDRVKQLFSSNGAFTQKLKAGKVYAELGHPKPNRGDDFNTFLRRIKRIEETNIVAHIKKVELVTQPTGEIYIYGWVKPFGPHAKVLEDSLNNPDINTAFSLRSITNDKVVNGKLIKEIKEIINFDMVLNNGIPQATKWKTIGIESSEILSLDLDNELVRNDIEKLIEMSTIAVESGEESCGITGCLKEIINDNNDDSDIVLEWASI